jgi:hypothetical protein
VQLTPFVPADAGTQLLPNALSFRLTPFSFELDSRLRGNERNQIVSRSALALHQLADLAAACFPDAS